MRENCTYGSMRGRAYPITRGVPLYSTPFSLLRESALPPEERPALLDGEFREAVVAAAEGSHARVEESVPEDVDMRMRVHVLREDQVRIVDEPAAAQVDRAGLDEGVLAAPQFRIFAPFVTTTCAASASETPPMM